MPADEDMPKAHYNPNLEEEIKRLEDKMDKLDTELSEIKEMIKTILRLSLNKRSGDTVVKYAKN